MQFSRLGLDTVFDIFSYCFTKLTKSDTDAVIDRQEQYSRCNYLLLHGVDGIEGEDTD